MRHSAHWQYLPSSGSSNFPGLPLLSYQQANACACPLDLACAAVSWAPSVRAHQENAMLSTAPALELQNGGEHSVDSGLPSSRQPPRRCSCLRCNRANGSFYARCIINDPEPDPTADVTDEHSQFFEDQDLVQASTLTKEQKSKVWRYIQEHDPNLLAFLKDEAVATLIKNGATPLFPSTLVRKALGRNQA